MTFTEDLAASRDWPGIDDLEFARHVQSLEEQPPVAEPPQPTIVFQSATEVRASTPAEPPWIWKSYMVRGNITLFGGRPKAGKSELLVGGFAHASVTGAASFLGQPIVSAPIVLVSEESAPTLKHKLPDSDDLRVLTRDAAWPKPSWTEIIDAATTEAHRVNASTILIDTMPYWAGQRPDEENSSGAALEVMNAAVQAARQGFAVGLILHSRKGGGEDGEGLRG